LLIDAAEQGECAIASSASETAAATTATTTATLSDAFIFDLVDVGKEYISVVSCPPIYDKLTSATSSSQLFAANASMATLMKDLDALLRTSGGFLLGQWVQDARAMAMNNSNSTGPVGKDYDADFLEWNARAQVTSWNAVGVETPEIPQLVQHHLGYQGSATSTGSPSGLESGLWDYGNKAWGGLVDPYYSTRYSIYATWKLQSITDKKTFNTSAYYEDMVNWAHSFQHQKWDETALPATATGDAVALSRALWKKYAPVHL
jgi:alpha-N-acetylglucosaminidase